MRASAPGVSLRETAAARSIGLPSSITAQTHPSWQVTGMGCSSKFLLPQDK
jgi:hypothetical protein